MCGIWGMFPTYNGGLGKIDLELAKQVMILTSLRGQDSTGVAVVHSSKQHPRVVKTVGDPFFLLNPDAWTKIEEFAIKKGTVMFGHGRFATLGAVNQKNAHPFSYEHITLVHNGTIGYGLDEEMKELNTENDSNALCMAIAQKGLVEALDAVVGAFAVIVHDAKEGKVHLVTNGDRPLHRLVLGNRHVVMSEAEALRMLDIRNKLTYNKAPQIEHYIDNVIYSYDIETQSWTTNDELEQRAKKWQTTSYKPVAPTTPVVTFQSGKKSSEPSGVKVKDDVVLMCIEVRQPDPATQLWKYIFLDEKKNEYVAISNKHEPEHEGDLCVSQGYRTVIDHVGNTVSRMVKFRELYWDKTAVQDALDKVVDEQLDSTVKTFNGKWITASSFKKITEELCCCLCDGNVNPSEINKTIVTDNGDLICTTCITEGKHFGMGFGQ